MPRVVTLQELTTLTANRLQPISQAIEIGPYRSLTTQLRVVVAGTGTVTLQHSAELEEDAFMDVGNALTLALVTSGGIAYTNLLRFVRWRGAWTAGAPRFQLELVLREA